MPTTRARRTTAKTITYAVLNKFQGGINSHPDKVNMQQQFTPMARNVEWLQTGGFFIRKGVGALTYGSVGKELAPPGEVALTFYHYVRDPTALNAFTSQYLVATEDGKVMVAVDYGAELGGPGTWTGLTVAGTALVTVGPPTFAAWDTQLYVSAGVATTSPLGEKMVRWDGAVATALGQAWANDYAAPSGGNMPLARYLVGWSERMWAGVIIPASGPVQGSRIRWSHPGKPEDWAENDYIDVGQQGDTITAIASMRDMLVVFKRSSMYALLGSGSTNFRVVELSGTTGCTGEWTRDSQGSVVFWDATLGLCRFNGKSIENLFEPLLRFIQPGAGTSITRCGGVVTDGEKVYVATDFIDYYGDRVPNPIVRKVKAGKTADPLTPGFTTWEALATAGVTWAALSGSQWLRVAVQFFNIIWVYREGAGWTSFTLTNPNAAEVTMLGQIRARLGPTGDIDSNRRIVYGLSNGTVPLYLSDRYDDGTDWWSPLVRQPIDSFYMTPWLHGGLPAQRKKWRAPRIIQEADQEGILLIDVYYDFNYDARARQLRVGVLVPLSFDSFSVGKPGTIGRARAVMLVIRPEILTLDDVRHWGISSITIPINPKTLR